MNKSPRFPLFFLYIAIGFLFWSMALFFLENGLYVVTGAASATGFYVDHIRVEVIYEKR